MYKTINQLYKEKFGCKVYKLSIDAGFSCPNRDGSKGTGGCIFCSAYGGGDFAERKGSVSEQLVRAKKRVEKKTNDGKYIAYFQAFSNTYADIETLKRLYSEAMEPNFIVGLAIGTRPDCLSDDIIELLRKINEIKPVSVELGLQTTDEDSARYIRRGYENQVYFDAVRRLKEAGLEVVTHIIIGLPSESKKATIKTTKDAVLAGTDGVKFHLLHILKGTDLEKEYMMGKFECLDLEEYAEILVECLRELKNDTVVHRITGDGAKRDLIAPLWSADKKKVLNFLNRYLRENL